jgi:hypothetical protein
MRIVLTNWKAAFVGERGSTFFTLYAVLVAGLGFTAWVRVSSDSPIIGNVLGFLLLMGPGLAVLRLQRHILAKSLLFCLPGYRESLRVLTFSGAIVFGAAWSLLFLTPPFQHPVPSVLRSIVKWPRPIYDSAYFGQS